MANLTLSEAISGIDGLLPKVANAAVEIMQAEAPKRTGHLARSIEVLEEGKDYAIVGTEEDYAYYVQKGRGEVVPRNKRSLHYFDNGKEVFSMRSKPTKPNDFVQRTKARLEAMSFNLTN